MDKNQQAVVEEARREYADQGCLALDTVLALTGLGIDPEWLEEQLEENIEFDPFA